MATENSNRKLVSFQVMSASVSGKDITAIAEIAVALSANTIPSLTLLVDPHGPKAGDQPVADGMSLDDAGKVIEEFLPLMRVGTLSLGIVVVTQDSTSTTSDMLNINGWLLTDVGLSPVERGGVGYVSLTFMHPICKSDFGGSIPGTIGVKADLDLLEGTDPLSVFESALQRYKKAGDERDPNADNAEIISAVVKSLGKATDALSATVRWAGPKGMPAEKQLGDWNEFLRRSMATYADPKVGTSVFNRFVSYLIPECSLALCGDYTNTLLDVKPFNPWAEPDVTISDADITTISFPQKDPTPISGVKLQILVAKVSDKPSFHFDESQIDLIPNDIYYVPKSEISADLMYGPIQCIDTPAWLEAARMHMLSCSDSGLSDTAQAEAGFLQTATSVERDQEAQVKSMAASGPDKAYKDAAKACAQAFYETSLMKDYTFTMNTRLMFSADGTIIAPGHVISVKSDDTEVLAGYVQAVAHSISVVRKSAQTSIVCGYPRFGKLPAPITEQKNALYG